jgi:hypothetical protein
MITICPVKVPATMQECIQFYKSQINTSGLRFSKQWAWRVSLPGCQHCAALQKYSDVSVDCITSSFGAEEQDKQETSKTSCLRLPGLYSSGLKIKVTPPSEMSVDFYRAARNYKPQDGTLHWQSNYQGQDARHFLWFKAFMVSARTDDLSVSAGSYYPTFRGLHHWPSSRVEVMSVVSTGILSSV